MPASESLLLGRKEGEEINGMAGEDSKVNYKDVFGVSVWHVGICWIIFVLFRVCLSIFLKSV